MWKRLSDEMLKMLRKIKSGGQTGADRAGLDFATGKVKGNGVGMGIAGANLRVRTQARVLGRK